MKRLAFCISLFITAPVLGGPAAVTTNVHASASACSAINLQYNTPHVGKLEFGDCTLEDGQYVDYFQFNGRRGDLVIVELRPLSTQLTQPFLVLLPPDGDPSNPPEMLGGEALEISHVLSTDGAWKVAMTSFDGSGRGEYLMLVELVSPRHSLNDRDCIPQYMRCGQVLFGRLTPESCRFSDSSDIFRKVGIDMEEWRRTEFNLYSEDFAPFVAVFDGEEGEYFGQAGYASRYQTATATASAPRDDYFQVIVSRDDSSLGDFVLEASCGYTACVWPIMIQTPQSVTVKRGERTTLSATAHGSDIVYKWYESNGPTKSMVYEGQSFTTPPTFENQDYLVEAQNECGTWESRVKVSVEEGRKRTVRRR